MARLGSNLPPLTTAAADADRVQRLLDRCPLGGLIVFRGVHASLPETLDALQAQSRIPLLVASDVERGVGQQVDGATVFPHAQAVGATDTPTEAAAQLARSTAQEARACGIHGAFAPVADVNTCVENPIIGIRAFGERTDRVAECVRAYVQAARAAGLFTTAKHFPGHGRTHADSHDTTPVVTADRAALDRVDLPPFQAAIDAGVDAIMTAHVAVPALDPEGRPATGAPPILQTLLREEMGFEGIVLTDSLLMEGGRVANTPGAQAAALLRAGVDVLLDPDDPEAVVDGLVAAVESGALSEARLDDAWQRVWRLKTDLHRRHGADAFRPTGAAVGTIDHAEAAASVAREAVRVQASTPSAWPLPPERVDDGHALHVIACTPRPSGEALDPLVDALTAAYPAVHVDVLTSETPSAQYEAAEGAAREARHLVVVAAVEPAAWHAFGLHDDQRAWMQRLVAGREAVVVALGSPHVLRDLPEASARVWAYSTVPASQRALVAHLTGAAGSPRAPLAGS